MGDEPLAALRAAEPVRHTAVLRAAAWGVGGIHVHPAYRVDGGCRCRGLMPGLVRLWPAPWSVLVFLGVALIIHGTAPLTPVGARASGSDEWMPGHTACSSAPSTYPYWWRAPWR